jgi:hypothetical protein
LGASETFDRIFASFILAVAPHLLPSNTSTSEKEKKRKRKGNMRNVLDALPLSCSVMRTGVDHTLDYL